MGKGRTSFRPLAVAGALCAALAACRSSDEADDLRSLLRVDEAALSEPSFVIGHRFGGWLEVVPDAGARPALESACLLEQTARIEEAIELLGDAVDSGLASAALFGARGALYQSSGYPRAAAGDFQRAVSLDAANPRYWYALGHAYESLELSRQSLEALEHSRSLGGDEPRLFLSLARVYRSLGREGQSARNYELALERLTRPPTEILVEAAVLASRDPARAEAVESLRERLEACDGTALSDDAWFLRALLRELPGEPAQNVAATFHALEIPASELVRLTNNLLLCVQLLDSETSAATRSQMLAAEPDARRRGALERCLSPK